MFSMDQVMFVTQRTAYLALGRGTAGLSSGFLGGCWPAGVDMLRFHG